MGATKVILLTMGATIGGAIGTRIKPDPAAAGFGAGVGTVLTNLIIHAVRSGGNNQGTP